MRRIGTVVVSVSLLALALMGAARAEAAVDVQLLDGLLVVGGSNPNDRNHFVIEHFADASRNGLRVRQTGFGDPTISSNDPDCVTNPAFNDVVCAPLATSILINSGVGDDTVLIGGSNVGCQTTTGTDVTINLQSGNDILRAGLPCGGQVTEGVNLLYPVFDPALGEGGNDDMSGGLLNDTMFGGDGADTVTGGGGADNLGGGNGNDMLSGSSGNDTLDGGAGADTLTGGSGVDHVTYDVGASLTPAVTVTLDSNANDGADGEGDNLISIENVTGSDSGDSIIGSATANTLDGGAGNDELIGGDGDDTLRGGANNDLIDARDGVGEAVNCGSGTDEAILDLQDTTVRAGRTGPSTCETVEQFALDDGPPGRIARVSIRIAADGALRIRIVCPRRARISCRGTIRLTPAGRGRALAKADYSVRRGRSRTARLTLSRADARRARARGRLVATTRERGVSKKGPRSSIRKLAVR